VREALVAAGDRELAPAVAVHVANGRDRAADAPHRAALGPVDSHRARADSDDAQVPTRPAAVDDERGSGRVAVATRVRAGRAEQDVSQTVAVHVARSA
jgi:hypothetical protein